MVDSAVTNAKTLSMSNSSFLVKIASEKHASTAVALSPVTGTTAGGLESVVNALMDSIALNVGMISVGNARNWSRVRKTGAQRQDALIACWITLCGNAMHASRHFVKNVVTHFSVTCATASFAMVAGHMPIVTSAEPSFVIIVLVELIAFIPVPATSAWKTGFKFS
jgi:hypothetical protein